ncbi:MAG: hypothetical protein AMJ64_02905, partial [Betaproteobacteria bacterium SG8_39]
VLFHIVAWAALVAGAAELTRFAGGLGPVFAALHLTTLGVLAMTAIGATLQLLPVATRQPVRSVRAAKLIWWLLTPGVALFATAAGLVRPHWMGPGAMLIVAALALYAWLLAENLRQARGMRVVVLHGWAALGALALLVVSGLALVAYYEHGLALDWRAFASLHLVAATYGFMGLLAMGLSQFLLPMFALSPAPAPRVAKRTLIAAAAAIGIALIDRLLVGEPVLFAAAAVLGLGAGIAHVVSMERALAKRLRPPLGPAFVLIRVGWACLLASLALALPLALGWRADGALAGFGVLLVAGWLLSFLLAVLQRIVPFLASAHAGGGARGMPLVSSREPGGSLAVHRVLHLAALAGLLVAIAAQAEGLARIAAATGLAGAVAFSLFFTRTLMRLRAARLQSGPAAPAPS